MPISTRDLGDDEEVLVDLHPHWAFWLGPALVSLVALGVAVAVAVEFPTAPAFTAWILLALVAGPLLWLVGRLVRWKTTSLVVTTTRILYVRGVLRRDLVQIRLQRVTEVHVTQSLAERLVGAGRLIVEIEGEQPVFLDDVRRPRTLQRVVVRQLDELTVGGRLANGSRPVQASRLGDDEPTPPHGVLAPAGGESTSAGERGVGPSSVHGQLVELDDLWRRGILSDDEFTAKKTQLLDRL